MRLSSSVDNRWLSSREAAERLGVKTETVYAYVSRGLIRRRRDAGGSSRLDPADVERLAARSRLAGARGDLKPWTIESAITSLQGRMPAYRGAEVAELAAARTFEAVALLLWTGELGSDRPWPAHEVMTAAARRAASSLDPSASDTDRFRVGLATMASVDPYRESRKPADVVRTAQAIIDGMIACLPALEGDAGPRPADSSIAERLWSRLSPLPMDDDRRRMMDVALTARADHELAASTLAARVAASSGATPCDVVLNGLGVAMGGSLGKRWAEVEDLLWRASSPSRACEQLHSMLDRGIPCSGFGHPLYDVADPRAGLIFHYIERARPNQTRQAHVESVVRAGADLGLPAPNSLLALVAMAHCFEMRTGASQAIAAVSRTAGWMAHGIEEYRKHSLTRRRAVYVGTPPARRRRRRPALVPGQLEVLAPRSASIVS